MGFSYKPLWHLLLELDINKTQFREELGLSTATLAKLGKDEYVSMDVLDKICTKYDVGLEKVVVHKKEQEG